MAVLGIGGKLYLQREAPEAHVFTHNLIDGNSNSIFFNCPGYWSGDRVTTMWLPAGGGNFPPNPDGYAMYYGGDYFVGPNRDQISTPSDTFYKAVGEEYPTGSTGDSAQFYARVGDTAANETLVAAEDGEYYIHIDEVGAVSFYTTRCAALEGDPDDRVVIHAGVHGAVGISPFGSADYNNAFWLCIKEASLYKLGDVLDSATLVSICEDAPDYESPEAGNSEYDNCDVQPRSAEAGQTSPYWQLFADIANWSLELSAPSVDTTGLSDKYGEAVKSIVTGGGSIEFLIDRKCFANDRDNGTALMKLLLMTDKGCKAKARFYVVNRGGGVTGTPDQIPGDLYYSTDLLVTNSAVNVRPADIIAGTANFVTTGQIKLLEATETVVQ